MTLYSHNGAIPAPLPFRITLPDGRTRTDPETFTPEEIAEAGYVAAPEAPAHDPLAEHPPEWDGSAWMVTAKTPAEIAADLDVAKAAKKELVKDHQAALFQAGWTHEFSVGTHTLDLRNADDKANWHLLLSKTDKMIAAGAGAAPVKLRTAANATIEIAASEANAAMTAFLSWGEDMLSAKWAVDEEIDQAADHAALAAIDITVGWP